MNRVILITGATGNIGGKLTAGILRDQPESQLVLLVRARTTAEGWLRVEGVLRALAPEVDLDNARHRVRVICGDITQEDFGLPEPMIRGIAAEVTHLIHSAATTQFNLPLPCARETNVTGTANMLAFARRAKREGRLERVAHISTAYVCGHRGGIIYEEDAACPGESANTYEQTKGEAEQLVHAAMADLPVAVIRPSIVVGDSRTGRTTAFNVLYTPLRFIQQGVLTLLACPPDTPLDVVPVDYVSDAIQRILFHSADFAGRTFHLVAGREHALAVREIVDRAVSFFNRTPGGVPLPQVLYVQKDSITESRLPSPRLRRMIDLARMFEPYTCVSRTFDDTHTQDALRSSNIRVSALAEYLETILEFGTQTDWGKRVRRAA